MNQEKIGLFIKERRKLKNLTQEELAELLGVNSRSVSRWENAKCMPDISLLKDLSKILGVTINDLISGEVVDKKNYQDTFEENVINLVDLKCKHIPIFKILLSSTIITIIILFVIFSLLFCLGHVKYIDKYSSVMNVERYPGNLIFMMKNVNVGEILSIVKNIDDITIIFVQQEYSLLDKIQTFKDAPTYSSTQININLNEISKNFKVYYTAINFEKIENANLENLKYIIDNSVLMYEE